MNYLACCLLISAQTLALEKDPGLVGPDQATHRFGQRCWFYPVRLAIEGKGYALLVALAACTL